MVARAPRIISLTAGSASAYSSAIDFSHYAGMAILVPSNLAASTYLAFQASYDGTNWNDVRDADGSYIQQDNSYAADWVTVKSDLFPFQNIRLAVTDGSGSASAGTIEYSVYLALKS